VTSAVPAMDTAPDTRIRQPAVAGLFYPDDATRLARDVDALLQAARTQPAARVRPATALDVGRPRALVVPHAAYQYSGPIAAVGYASVRDGRPARVVLIGPAHYVRLTGCAVPRATAWHTPLGLLPVDPVARDLAVRTRGVRADDEPHAPEHSLEVQLPFLQRSLGEPAVLPVVAHAAAAMVADLLDAVAGEAGTLVLASTDLSHHLPDPVARERDARTAEAILGLRPDLIGDRSACGAHALRGLLDWAARHQLRPRQLALATSADAGGDPRRVVGYGAFAFC
jgi:AmmeMemoRadiSam system protein B